MQWNFPYHQRYCQHDYNGRYEPVLFGDGRHTENERVSGGINGGVGSSFGTSVTKISPVVGGIAGILGLGGLAASA